MSINAVAPLAGAWIEIVYSDLAGSCEYVAPLAGAWIEIVLFFRLFIGFFSRSPRGSVD